MNGSLEFSERHLAARSDGDMARLIQACDEIRPEVG